MPTVGEIAARLEQLAPLSGAEEWDNVGLLVGDTSRRVSKVMTCLTITPATAAEAISRQAEMVVVHHPLPFRPLSRVTTDTTVGRLLWELIGAGVSVYSAHTAYDSALQGINEQWAQNLDLTDVDFLVPTSAGDRSQAIGAGRWGVLSTATTLGKLADRIKEFLSIKSVNLVGDDQFPVQRIAVACGSGNTFLEAARQKRCDCLVTGETNFHSCLEAEANRIGLVLCGHFASERFAMERLAEVLGSTFTDLDAWASHNEVDPLHVR